MKIFNRYTNELIIEIVDLSKADLRGADLRGADLREADLREVNLCEADLSVVDLSDANLIGANLRGANLSGANLTKIKTSLYTTGFNLVCPETGSYIAWKKVKTVDCNNTCIIKLQIPSKAKRSSATTRKCRASFVKVLQGNGYTDEYKKTEYKQGEVVYSDSWDENRWNECSNGIHHFINKFDAEQWIL